MKVLIIATHPDDETLGCGGTILKHFRNGDEIYWLIVTKISTSRQWSKKIVESRKKEINIVKSKYNFKKVFELGYNSTELDLVSISEMVAKISLIYKEIMPETIYLPFVNDVHTDHQITGKVFQSTFKWFRYPSIKKVLMYETLSETEFDFLSSKAFRPNSFVDISDFLNEKVNIMKVYKSEILKFPFPRSEKNIFSLANFRGAQSGYEAAEAFQLVFER